MDKLEKLEKYAIKFIEKEMKGIIPKNQKWSSQRLRITATSILEILIDEDLSLDSKAYNKDRDEVMFLMKRKDGTTCRYGFGSTKVGEDLLKKFEGLGPDARIRQIIAVEPQEKAAFMI